MHIEAHGQWQHRRHQQRKQDRERHMVVHRPIIGLKTRLASGLASGLLVACAPAALAAPVLRVGVLDQSPPCAERVRPGIWQGKAVDLWRRVAEQQRLPYLLEGYATPQALLEASQSGRVDVGVGCLTISPERLGRFSFSLPFQEEGLAVLMATDRFGAGRTLLKVVLNPQLLQVLAGYLVAISLLSLVVWRDEHRNHPHGSRRERLRSYALIFQVLATGPGTNVIVSRSRGHLLVIVSWVVRIVGGSLILSTITVDALKQPLLGRYRLESIADLEGLRVAVRPGSVSAKLLQEPPLRGRVQPVDLGSLQQAPALLLQNRADVVLADEAQLQHLLNRLPAAERRQLQLDLRGTSRQSQALAFSPRLDPSVADRIDRAISEAKRDGQLQGPAGPSQATGAQGR
jgi:polar amino acid transport system substrate-binding protein